MNQKHSSAETSLCIVNKVYTHYDFTNGSSVLDYGGGKYDMNTMFMKERGVDVSVYDKFNRSEEHNTRVLRTARQTRPDYVVCSNVLNVIMEDEVIDSILEDMASFGSRTIISVYEGDRTGDGRETSKGYQRNERLSEYIPMVKKHFDIISKKGGILECLPR